MKNKTSNPCWAKKQSVSTRQKKTVKIDDGTAVPYDKLMVATGSRPFVPPIDGLDEVDNKFTFMTIDDALALDKALTSESRVLIVGAGLIGLKCAEAVADRVGSLVVVDMADRVMPTVLRPGAAKRVQDHLEEAGMQFYLSDTVVRFENNAAHLKSGKAIDFDVLVMAVGVRPNTELVANAGGLVGQGHHGGRRRTNKPVRRICRGRLHPDGGCRLRGGAHHGAVA